MFRSDSGNIFVILLISLSALTAYSNIGSFDFISYDDYKYVVENPYIKDGLSPYALKWAFGATYCTHWHPLTWISHMIDISLFKMNPGWHHIVNLIFHLANVIVLYVLIYGMTQSRWQSTVVSMLFALHPMNVESVAWIAERKNVLSTFFWLLTLVSYMRYANTKATAPYLLALLCFLAALMTKAMSVTIPVTMLLLDYWPLGRLNAKTVFLEKIPFYILSLLISITIFLIQDNAGTIYSLQSLSLSTRLGSVVTSYTGYIEKMFLPLGLAIFYPLNLNNSPLYIVTGFVTVALITVIAVWQSSSRKYILFGWLWFLLTFIPVIQLVRMIGADIADRYVYVPYIGLFVILANMTGELRQKFPGFKPTTTGLFLCISIILLYVAHKEVGFWVDSSTLYRRALSVTLNNYVIHNNYGQVLLKQDKTEEALSEFSKGLSIMPENRELNYNYMVTLASLGKKTDIDDRIRSLQNTKAGIIYEEIARALLKYKKYELASTYFLYAIAADRTTADTYDYLSMAYALQGKCSEAIESVQKGLDQEPTNLKLLQHRGLYKDELCSKRNEQTIDSRQ